MFNLNMYYNQKTIKDALLQVVVLARSRASYISDMIKQYSNKGIYSYAKKEIVDEVLWGVARPLGKVEDSVYLYAAKK